MIHVAQNSDVAIWQNEVNRLLNTGEWKLHTVAIIPGVEYKFHAQAEYYETHYPMYVAVLVEIEK